MHINPYLYLQVPIVTTNQIFKINNSFKIMQVYNRWGIKTPVQLWIIVSFTHKNCADVISNTSESSWPTVQTSHMDYPKPRSPTLRMSICSLRGSKNDVLAIFGIASVS